jgi:hypothetical protein
MKSYIEQIVGKTIAGVVVRDAHSEPKRQVFLVFTDDTHFELYGDYFAFGKHVYPGGMAHVIKVAELGAKEVAVYNADKGS